ncbi:Fic family protein [Enterococcus faecium]|uniref:Fic family protein n=1 Tax=Enterococcus faecium TaxID=1352 RepID=UPI0019FADD7D|nr:Fic family protein [Enterococcus faecium]EGP4915024.1 Fic family protein [Enterococcus faecium]EGP5559518.1 Fic family protein [Enterococcus faecium]EME8201028.1 Fic family protein [Enterococcus faecium]EMF0611638.1 Fic family protein [Enterococcus faecium]MCL6148095.1 Fic family protein [Enterococcus faecium]
MDNTALARFITSLGSLNNYGSTVLQTKKALDQKSTKPLRQNKDDIAIFTDALKGIDVIKQIGFSTDGIIAVNKQFDSPSDEQPGLPGHLRNAYYNEDDRIAIIIDQQSQEAYLPPDVVTRADIDQIVETYNQSEKEEKDAWCVFAQLSKLQAFQDGNKRTALIAANAAYGTFENENYLTLPFNDLDRVEFTLNLMRYYQAMTPEEEEKAFERMLDTLPSPKERELALHAPIQENKNIYARTYRIKAQLNNPDIDR